MRCHKGFKNWSFSYGPLHGDDYSTCIMVDIPSNSIKLRIIVAMEVEDAFCNEDLQTLELTPYHKGLLLVDSKPLLFRQCYDDMTFQCASLQNTSTLGRLWLKRIGASGSLLGGGFGGFEWDCLLIALISSQYKSRDIYMTKKCSARDLFRGALQYIAEGATLGEEFTFGEVGAFFPENCLQSPEKHKVSFLIKLSETSMKFLRISAQRACDYINLEKSLLSISRLLSEGCFHADMRLNANFVVDRFSPDEPGPSEPYRAMSELCALLCACLGDRVVALSYSCAAPPNFLIACDQPSSFILKFSMYFILNSSAVLRTIDYGPNPHNLLAVKRFKHFWGERSELRRFKNGSICECVVWETHSFESRNLVLVDMLEFLLQRHFKTISFASEMPTQKLIEAAILDDDKYLYKGIASQDPYPRVLQLFDALCRKLKDISGLPIYPKDIRGAGNLLRNTSIHSARLYEVGKDFTMPAPAFCTEPLDISMTFEESTKWPSELSAIQVTKTGLILAIGRALEADGAELKVDLVFENTENSFANGSYLRITQRSGYIYNIRIHYEYEKTLLKLKLRDPRLLPLERYKYLDALKFIQARLVMDPMHTAFMQHLVREHPSMSFAIRVMKRWFAGHLLSAHISDQIVELLVANLYSLPSCSGIPSTVEGAFGRCLHLLSTWNWAKDALVVGSNLNSPPIERSEPIRYRLVTSYDPSGTAWTSHLPEAPIAARITLLAKAALATLRSSNFSSYVSVYS